jgi:hypothetical protein
MSLLYTDLRAINGDEPHANFRNGEPMNHTEALLGRSQQTRWRPEW